MVKQREMGFVRIINEPAKSRIERNECPSCGKPKTDWKRRQSWTCCSVECTSKFESYCIIRTWPELRLRAFKRDNFKCVMCGHSPMKEDTYTIGTSQEVLEHCKNYPTSYPLPMIVSENPVTIRYIDIGSLIGDHIIAIALGGDQWDINNIQTLCVNCNKIKTRDDAKKIAKLRRNEVIDKIGQSRLE